jgi:hypothetical protein
MVPMGLRLRFIAQTIGSGTLCFGTADAGITFQYFWLMCSLRSVL